MYGNSIFEALYDGVIDERNRKKRMPNNDPETVAYDKLEAALNDEQKTLLDKFMEEYADNEDKFRREAYARGVKIGIKLGYEAADYNPED